MTLDNPTTNTPHNEDFEQFSVKKKEDESLKVVKKIPRDTAANTLEDILVKIGVGRYNIIAGFLVALGTVMEGAEVSVVAILNFVFKGGSWQLSDSQIQWLGSALFAGLFIGSMFSGQLADKFGRRGFFLWCMVLSFLTCVASALSVNFTMLVITRALYGITYGGAIPICTTILQEISPMYFRGKGYVLFQAVGYVLGQVLSIAVAQMTNTTGDNSEGWRYLLIWTAVPALISTLFGLCFLKETPRFALNESYEKGLEVLQHMHKKNHSGKEIELTPEQVLHLQSYSVNHQEDQNDDQKASMKSLFQGNNLKITICIWIIWFAASIIYYGINYILPIVLGNDEDGEFKYFDLYLTTIPEIPAVLLVYFIIEHPDYGRKNSIILSLLLCLVASFVVWIFPSVQVGFIAVLRVGAAMVFGILIPFTAECYSTHYRVTGTGISSSVGGVGGIIMPWIVLSVLNVSPYFPFFLFGIFAIACIVSAVVLGIETAGKSLDIDFIEEEKKNKEKQQGGNEATEESTSLLNADGE